MSLYRILKSPDVGEGGVPRADAADTIEPASRDASDAVGESKDEGQVTRLELDAILEAREVAHARELAARDQKAADWERAYKAALRDRELATALASRPLIAGAAPQLIKLWRDDFDVYEDGGEFKVAARDGRTVGQAVAEWLASPEYTHFCQPSSRGGTATLGANRSATTGAPPSPRNLGEAAIVQWQEAASRANTSSSPIGLGRRR